MRVEPPREWGGAGREVALGTGNHIAAGLGLLSGQGRAVAKAGQCPFDSHDICTQSALHS